MSGFALCLTIHRLRLSVRLGYPAEERAVPQAVELELKCYFETLPAAALSEEGDFLCYDRLAGELAAFCAAREFRFIEHLASELLAEIRRHVDAVIPAEAAATRLWLRALKCEVPVAAIEGGCSVTVSELPGGIPL